ncbi:MAG: putative aminoglycoside phosphotransferase (protein kinase related), diverged [Clostridiales bacterium]|jgi:thiamine kinase-like enzyme|nr:putative aminoglycoside phosphotransferase (protein kinase related), diverged [Clostridiales bacterium]
MTDSLIKSDIHRQELGLMIGQGNTAEIYQYGTNKILKLYRKGLPEAFCKNEFEITKNIYDLLGLCPNAFDVIEVDGRVGAIYEKIDGQTMLKSMLSRVWSIRKQSKLLAHYHESIQKPIEFEIPTVKDKLKYDIESVNELSEVEKKKLFHYIDNLPDGNILCHFDFHPDNILMSKERVVIIDWMTACKGNALADVARTSIMLKYGSIQIKSAFVKMIINKFRKKIYQHYIAEYIKNTNCNFRDIEKWEVPIAAARLCEWIPEDEKKKLLSIVQEFIKVQL